MHIARLSTPDGAFTAHFSARGLARLEFPSARAAPATEPLPSRPTLSPALRKWQTLTVQALREALTGRAPRGLPPLDLAEGTEFQRRVWSALRRIPSGQTRTYAQLAEVIGAPKAVRAVGNACGANPIPVLVPCHRVLGSDGRLGGFSAGLAWKRRLLAREGAWPAELWE